MNKNFKKIIRRYKNTISVDSVSENHGATVVGYVSIENISVAARKDFYGRKYGHAPLDVLYKSESLMGLKPHEDFNRGDHKFMNKQYFIGKVVDFYEKPMVKVDEFISYKEYLAFIRNNQDTRKSLAYNEGYKIVNLCKVSYSSREEFGECLVIDGDVYNSEGKYIGRYNGFELSA